MKNYPFCGEEKDNSMDKIKLDNDHARWVDNSNVKIGRCKKCKAYHSAALSEHMKWFRDYCYACNAFRTFAVQPKIKFIDDEVSCYGALAG